MIGTGETISRPCEAPASTNDVVDYALEATILPSVQLEVLLGYARTELLRLAGEQGEDSAEIDDDIVAFACPLAFEY
jgi:hypothetical protein